VLVNLAKDPISSNFSGNECILYRKELFHRCQCVTITRSQARDLTRRKLTVCSPSYHGNNWSC